MTHAPNELFCEKDMQEPPHPIIFGLYAVCICCNVIYLTPTSAGFLMPDRSDQFETCRAVPIYRCRGDRGVLDAHVKLAFVLQEFMQYEVH